MPQHQCKAANMLWFAPAFQPVARITDIFEVEPNKMCVASRSNAFATVLFTPQAMQSYQCVFEATLDGLPRYCASLRTTAPHCLWQGSLTHKPSASICPWPVRNQATQQERSSLDPEKLLRIYSCSPWLTSLPELYFLSDQPH